MTPAERVFSRYLLCLLLIALVVNIALDFMNVGDTELWRTAAILALFAALTIWKAGEP